MSQPRAQGGLRIAAVFSLCALFAILAMGLTLLSSSVYRATAADADTNYTHRTALSYLMNQVRRSDGAGLVSTGFLGDAEALVLTERLDGASYVTMLYCHEGQLRELYMEEGTGLTPADGVAILPISALDVALEGGVLRLQVTDEQGGQFSGSVALRSAGEGGGR